jgi:hypothetical protein
VSEIETIRVVLAAVAYGSWAPESQRPDARVALDALESLSLYIDKLEAALREITNPPLVLDGDNALQVADWFVGIALAALSTLSEQPMTHEQLNTPEMQAKIAVAKIRVGVLGEGKTADELEGTR